MNSNLPQTIKNDLFHYLTGSFTRLKNGRYLFDLSDSNLPYPYYDTFKSTLIVDPSFDSSFKALFLNNKERLQNFLNCVFFQPLDMEISNLEYIIGERDDIGKRYNLNSLKADIACKAEILGKNNVILDIEIQINWLEEVDFKFLSYGAFLKNACIKAEKEENKPSFKGRAKKIYNNIMVIGFILDEKKPYYSNKIELLRTTSNLNQQTIIPEIKIYEINIYKELENFKFNKEIKLFGKKLSKEGVDWIKLIGLRFWAEKKEGTFGKYTFPVIKYNEEKYSQNHHIEEIIYELLEGNDLETNLFSQLQEEFAQNFNKGLNEGMTKGVAQGFDLGKKEEQLATAYKLIVNGKEDALDVLSLEYQYTKQEVYSILKSVKLNYLERLFNYLKEHGLLVYE